MTDQPSAYVQYLVAKEVRDKAHVQYLVAREVQDNARKVYEDAQKVFNEKKELWDNDADEVQVIKVAGSARLAREQNDERKPERCKSSRAPCAIEESQEGEEKIERKPKAVERVSRDPPTAAPSQPVMKCPKKVPAATVSPVPTMSDAQDDRSNNTYKQRPSRAAKKKVSYVDDESENEHESQRKRTAPPRHELAASQNNSTASSADKSREHKKHKAHDDTSPEVHDDSKEEQDSLEWPSVPRSRAWLNKHLSGRHGIGSFGQGSWSTRTLNGERKILHVVFNSEWNDLVDTPRTLQVIHVGTGPVMTVSAHAFAESKNSIPLFFDRKRKDLGIEYVGHWKCVNWEDYDPPLMFQGKPRAVGLTLEFDRFDKKIAAIMADK